MMKNIIMLVVCAGIVALSWVFYAFWGEYAVSIFLTIIFISILVKPIKSRFSNKNNKKSIN